MVHHRHEFDFYHSSMWDEVVRTEISPPLIFLPFGDVRALSAMFYTILSINLGTICIGLLNHDS
jgi:hypothetical protein